MQVFRTSARVPFSGVVELRPRRSVGARARLEIDTSVQPHDGKASRRPGVF
jgi:hypothetical protein